MTKSIELLEKRGERANNAVHFNVFFFFSFQPIIDIFDSDLVWRIAINDY